MTKILSFYIILFAQINLVMASPFLCPYHLMKDLPDIPKKLIIKDYHSALKNKKYIRYRPEALIKLNDENTAKIFFEHFEINYRDVKTYNQRRQTFHMAEDDWKNTWRNLSLKDKVKLLQTSEVQNPNLNPITNKTYIGLNNSAVVEVKSSSPLYKKVNARSFYLQPQIFPNYTGSSGLKILLRSNESSDSTLFTGKNEFSTLQSAINSLELVKSIFQNNNSLELSLNFIMPKQYQKLVQNHAEKQFLTFQNDYSFLKILSQLNSTHSQSDLFQSGPVFLLESSNYRIAEDFRFKQGGATGIKTSKKDNLIDKIYTVNLPSTSDNNFLETVLIQRSFLIEGQEADFKSANFLGLNIDQVVDSLEPSTISFFNQLMTLQYGSSRSSTLWPYLKYSPGKSSAYNYLYPMRNWAEHIKFFSPIVDLKDSLFLAKYKYQQSLKRITDRWANGGYGETDSSISIDNALKDIQLALKDFSQTSGLLNAYSAYLEQMR